MSFQTYGVHGLLFAIAVGAALVQVLIKVAANAYRSSHGVIWAASFLTPLAIALIIAVAVQLVWLWALQYVPLGRAYMALALTFILVPLAAFLLFSEPLSKTFAIGALLIVAGIVLATTR